MHCCVRTTRRGFIAGAGGAATLAGGPALAQAPGAGSEGSVPPVRASRLQPFDMADVTLLDGPFLHAQKLTERYLLALQPDRMLHNFRVNAGLQPKAPVYGGWESVDTWADINCHGHTLGHYLSACALAFRSTGEARYREPIEYIAVELAACQRASDSGLVCAFPDGPRLLVAHLKGEKITGVPWYTLHKIYAGLRDAVLLAGSETSREVLLRLADWGVVATRPLSDAEFEAMLQTEHGGMNEVYADLYLMTGNADYQALARRFSHKALLQPLSRQRDHLDGLHANTQVPKAVGFQRVWEVTGEAAYRDAAAFFWKTVAETRSFVTGGHGDGEHFFAMSEIEDHIFSAKGSETCGQHNMLKLTRGLFLHDPDPAYADFYERTLFNGILASQDPDSGMTTYFQGALPGYMKLYHTPEDSFWCCTGTGMENHVKYRDSLYFHEGDTLYVNLFVPLEVHWRAKGAVLRQDTAFPEKPTTSLHWTLERPVDASLKLRHPGWSQTATVLVNGAEAARSASPGSWIDLARRWRDGDRIELRLDMALGVVTHPGAPDIAALTYGPLVLAAALGREGLADGADIVINERKFGEYNNGPVAVPQLAGPAGALPGRVRATGKPLEWTIRSADGRDVRLVPYHRIAHERYATYWKLAPAAA